MKLFYFILSHFESFRVNLSQPKLFTSRTRLIGVNWPCSFSSHREMSRRTARPFPDGLANSPFSSHGVVSRCTHASPIFAPNTAGRVNARDVRKTYCPEACFTQVPSSCDRRVVNIQSKACTNGVVHTGVISLSPLSFVRHFAN